MIFENLDLISVLFVEFAPIIENQKIYSLSVGLFVFNAQI